MYDVIVVGAGPAGLMAGKQLKGLSADEKNNSSAEAIISTCNHYHCSGPYTHVDSRNIILQKPGQRKKMGQRTPIT